MDEDGGKDRLMGVTMKDEIRWASDAFLSLFWLLMVAPVRIHTCMIQVDTKHVRFQADSTIYDNKLTPA